MLSNDKGVIIIITRGKWYKKYRFRELSLLIFQKRRSAKWQARVWTSATMMPFPAIVNLIKESTRKTIIEVIDTIMKRFIVSRSTEEAVTALL